MNTTAAYALILAGSGLCFIVAMVRIVTAAIADAHARRMQAAIEASARRQAIEHRAAVARIVAASRKELTR